MKIIVKEGDQGLRLDQFLGKAGFAKNRSQALKLILQERVKSGGRPLKASRKLKAGDELEISLPEEGPAGEPFPPRRDIHVEIVYEDEEILVADKPAGLVVHPSPGHEADTLVNVLFQGRKLSPGSGPFRPGIVHRLDKEASGLMVLSKTKPAEESLAGQFKARSAKRIYWTLVFGAPAPKEGIRESYLMRHPSQRQKFISLRESRPGAKKAITRYRTLKTHGGGLSWLECALETGRTHQIRAQLASFGHPVAGDLLYGKKRRLKSLKGKKLREMCGNLGRIALHARCLSFVHPASNREITFRRGWPLDLKELLLETGFWREGGLEG